MPNLLSREILKINHFYDHLSDYQKYENCKYKIYVPLNTAQKYRPQFSSVSIENIYDGKRKTFPIISGRNDRRHVGEFIFLLAAKFRYDLLYGMEGDNAGFLHSDEIKKLNNNGHTKVPPSIYASLNYVRRKSAIEGTPEDYFINKFLFEPNQLCHLICFWGTTVAKTEDADFIWWLNVLAEDIEFRDGNNTIPDKVLQKHLARLFPKKYLLAKKEIKELCDRLDKRIPNRSETSKADTDEKQTVIVPSDSLIKEFREKLREEAQSHLLEKLHGKGIDDYRPLGLEIGLIEQSDSIDEDLNSEYEGHNRVWKEFECKQLENTQGTYILSSETGSGKTTFLRNLQLIIIEQTELIPIFLHASELEDLKFKDRNIDSFLKSLGGLFQEYLQDGQVQKFLKEYLAKIVLLVDGLDQIEGTGTEYKNLIDKLLAMFKDRLVITSRPFAVIGKEKNTNIKFLRLKSFNKADIQAYFGDKYKRAKELLNKCPEKLYIPMLAYLIRLLIEEGRDRQITNVAQLYKNFIDYIFEEYPHDNLSMSFEYESEIRDALGKISYEAIANNDLFFQKIPLQSARNYIQANIKVDDLLKYGLVHIIVNRSEGIDKFLYFSHQSFQEYLAAEWASQKEERAYRILNELIEEINGKEYYYLKWEEVVVFLTGLMGEVFLEKVYNEWHKDKSNYSRLIAASICCRGLNPLTKYGEILFKDIVGILENADYYIGLDDSVGLAPYKFRIFFQAMLNSDFKKANNYIFKLALEYLAPKNPVAKYYSFKKQCSSIALDDFLFRLELTQNQVNELVNVFFEHANSNSFFFITRFGNIAGLDKFESKHLYETIDYECQDAAEASKAKKPPLFISKIVARKVKTEHLDKICEIMVESLGRDVQNRMLEILTVFPFPEKIKQQHILKIFSLLNSDGSDLQKRTFKCLRSLLVNLKEDNIASIIDFLKNKNRDAYVQKLAFQIIRQWLVLKKRHISASKFCELLVDFLMSNEENTRLYAAATIGKIIKKTGSSRNLQRIFKFLNNENLQLRYAALRVVYNTNAKFKKKQIQSIINQLKVKDKRARCIAAAILNKINLNSNQVNTILTILKDSNYRLKRIPFPQNLPENQKELVLSFLKSSKATVRANGLKIVRKCNIPLNDGEIDFISKYFQDEDPHVVKEALLTYFHV